MIRRFCFAVFDTADSVDCYRLDGEQMKLNQ